MAKPRKNYGAPAEKVVSIQSAPKSAGTLRIDVENRTFHFDKWVTTPGSPTAGSRLLLVREMHSAIHAMQLSGVSPSTIKNFCASGMSYWFKYLDEESSKGRMVVTLDDITPRTVERYTEWLKRQPARGKGPISVTSARAIYNATKSVLMNRVRAGLLSIDIFPQAPFPNADRAYVGHQGFSQGEVERLLSALLKDLALIRAGQLPNGSEAAAMSVYLLLIAARSGRNLTPLLELGRAAITDHPLKPDMGILQVYKRRGFKIHRQSFRYHSNDDDSTTVPSDVVTLYREALSRSAQFIDLAPKDLQDRAWLYRAKGRGVTCLNDADIAQQTTALVSRHQIKSDRKGQNGEPLPLKVNVSRLRKTFTMRMWQLTGGNLFKTAQLAGNSPRMTDSHYLAVTPDMERNHKFVGRILEGIMTGEIHDQHFRDELSAKLAMTPEKVDLLLSGALNTGVARCTDPLNGRFAPRNGTANCQRFLHCFRCPNQVVIESDLYRLFSFYWLLIKERGLLGKSRWKSVYAWVIRAIDNDIAPHFDPIIVERERQRALASPHPMWRDRTLLGGEG
ncbi:hypothetical protein ACT3R4_17680 [Halomonas sp. AOP7-E1-9]|uniref:hypothetical protein n=1 Tax=Halomonas sp. TaxID=1486246 RepID=UPI003F9721CE